MKLSDAIIACVLSDFSLRDERRSSATIHQRTRSSLSPAQRIADRSWRFGESVFLRLVRAFGMLKQHGARRALCRTVRNTRCERVHADCTRDLSEPAALSSPILRRTGCPGNESNDRTLIERVSIIYVLGVNVTLTQV